MNKVKKINKIKRNIKASKKIVKQHLKISRNILETSETENGRKFQLENEARKHYNNDYQDLQGKNLFIVHFVEYKDSKLYSDTPVFYATAPEWAMGFCKFNKDYASKSEDGSVNWWYWYLENASINEKNGGLGYLCSLDWNGNIVDYTYHIDKGYKHNYVKEKVILLQEDNCQECVKNEQSEDEKTFEKSKLATEEIKTEIQKYFSDVKDLTVDITIEGDWHKVIARSERFKDQFFDHYVYDNISQKYCLGIGNKILFYFGVPVINVKV